MNNFPQQDMAPARAAHGWRGWLADMAGALALLTVLPIPARWRQGAAWPRALRLLPLIGAFIGLVQGLLLLVLWLLPMLPLAAVLLAMLGGMLLTGALHEDGLADLADALGGRTPQQRLAIMRDARIGSFGVLALLFATGLQVVALAGLLEHGSGAVLAALALAHATSRLAVVWLMHTLPHARDDGMSVASGRPDGAALAVATLPVMLLALLAWPRLGGALPVALIMALPVAGLMRLACVRLLGGQTGDAAGALEVMVRTTLLLVLAA